MGMAGSTAGDPVPIERKPPQRRAWRLIGHRIPASFPIPGRPSGWVWRGFMQLNREIFTKLKENVAIFRNFNDGELLGVLKATQREVFQDNEIVFKEGTRGDKMYIIISGGIRISRPIGRKEEEVLARLESGQLFCEMGPMHKPPS